MNTRHPKLLIDDHVELGNLLKEVRSSLTWLMQRSTMSSKFGRDALKTLLALDQLRHSLDDQLHHQISFDRDPRRVTAQVYFGEQRFHLRSYDPDELEADLFAPWAPGL
jgi:hypothetical protein